MQLLIAFATTGVVIVTLGVSQNGLVALDLHVKQQFVKVHQLLLERVLEQDVVARHRYQMVGSIFLIKIFVHAVLGTQVQLDAETGIGYRVLELQESIHQALARVLKGHRRHMGCEDDIADTHFLFCMKHL